MQLAAQVQQVRATQESFPVSVAKERNGDEDVAVWVTKSSPWFPTLEALEADVFFDGSPVSFAESGFDFEFLVIAGGEEGNHRVRHVMRVGLPTQVDGYADPLAFFAQDMFESGQGVDYTPLAQQYRDRGYDLRRIPSVESSIRTEGLSSRIRSTTVLAYYSLVERLRTDGYDGVFAHNNSAAAKSMRRIGIVMDEFSLNQELHTPKLDTEGFDSDFRPMFMPVCDATVDGLSRLVKNPPRCLPPGLLG